METPPVPCVNTQSPAFKAFVSSPYSAFHAVSPAHDSVAASMKLSPSGMATNPFSLKEPYSLNVP